MVPSVGDNEFMTVGPISELNVPYDPQTIELKVQGRRRRMRSQLVSLGLTVVILAGIYLWQRDQLQGAGFLVVYGLVLAIPLILFLVFLLGYRQSKGELATMGTGTAVRVGVPGIQVAGVFAGWSEVASLGAVPAGIGRAPLLRLATTDGRQATVPFDQIATYPATLDSTVRALSGGRHGVDLAALDN
jgi:F0F1-type ATP synthase assembly protein I